MITTTNLRDNSITDITIIDFDTVGQRHLDERSGPDSLELLECNQKVKRLTLIHRQNNIQSTTQDTAITSEQSEQHTKIQQQNKSSPDKSSQATTIIIILLILLAILIFIKFILK